MSFLDLLKIEFMKVKRSKIVPLIFIAPLLVVVSGVASLSNYFTPEYTNTWPAMFIQSALVYALSVSYTHLFCGQGDNLAALVDLCPAKINRTSIQQNPRAVLFISSAQNRIDTQ